MYLGRHLISADLPRAYTMGIFTEINHSVTNAPEGRVGRLFLLRGILQSASAPAVGSIHKVIMSTCIWKNISMEHMCRDPYVAQLLDNLASYLDRMG